MNFWKRIRWVSSALLLALWLIAVLAGSWQRDSDPPAKAPLCATCGL